MTVTFYDGYVAEFDLLRLRQGCPCATCRNMRERGEDSWPRPDSPVPLRVEHAGLAGALGAQHHLERRTQHGHLPLRVLRQWHEGPR